MLDEDDATDAGADDGGCATELTADPWGADEVSTGSTTTGTDDGTASALDATATGTADDAGVSDDAVFDETGSRGAGATEDDADEEGCGTDDGASCATDDAVSAAEEGGVETAAGAEEDAGAAEEAAAAEDAGAEAVDFDEDDFVHDTIFHLQVSWLQMRPHDGWDDEPTSHSSPTLGLTMPSPHCT